MGLDLVLFFSKQSFIFFTAEERESRVYAEFFATKTLRQKVAQRFLPTRKEEEKILHSVFFVQLVYSLVSFVVQKNKFNGILLTKK